MDSPQAKFYRDYDLGKVRQYRSIRQPAVHQHEALGKLQTWFKAPQFPAGSVLALPTGGGKTFTAIRFLCTSVLSQADYKVLWLAHTHHLLEQAFYSFGPEDIQDQLSAGLPDSGLEVGHITGGRSRLAIRVVSGGKGYHPVHKIKATDDVLICTLQTITKAYQKQHPQLEAFLNSVKQDKFCVVFDEAHHLPAASYRKLISALRERFPKMHLLGLTATPTYHDQRRSGWLKKLFPQGVKYQASVEQLMAAEILAKPIFEQPQRTEFIPNFDPDKYAKWVKTYRDLPESIITQLAESQQRNEFIAKVYADNREKYGKTIIFADRWFQCEQLKTFLERHGVKAGTVYSHVDADTGGGNAQNYRDQDENSRVLAQFRRNEIDVLINIRMLTEGTDVPDVQTVFLTRQTTSAILLTQMVGRALRGPKFGGTKEAYIVPFIDDWRQIINWAPFDLVDGGTETGSQKKAGQQALQMISVNRVIQLTHQQDSGIPEQVRFLQLLPIGWYQSTFECLVEDSEDAQLTHQLILVFKDEKDNYARFIREISKESLNDFESESITINDCKEQLKRWQEKYFDLEEHVGDGLFTNIFHLARHIAQNPGIPPKFFVFEERKNHNMDLLAAKCITEKLGPQAIRQKLQDEYDNPARYWNSIYPDFGYFKAQYNACQDRLLQDFPSSKIPLEEIFDSPEDIPEFEVSNATKAEIKKRDGKRCLCCGSTSFLEIDHIQARYYGGDNDIGNLQTLCRRCNLKKGTEKINFMSSTSPLKYCPNTFPEFHQYLTSKDSIKKWEAVLRSSINFFYRCSAVESFEISSSSHGEKIWRVTLKEGVDSSWLHTHLSGIEWTIHVRRGRHQKLVIDRPLATLISRK